MKTYTFNYTELTKETIKKTDLHFANISQGCIDEVISGDVIVNDIKKYIKDKEVKRDNYLKGNINRNNFTYLQRAYWIQTGETIALLP